MATTVQENSVDCIKSDAPALSFDRHLTFYESNDPAVVKKRRELINILELATHTPDYIIDDDRYNIICIVRFIHDVVEETNKCNSNDSMFYIDECLGFIKLYLENKSLENYLFINEHVLSAKFYDRLYSCKQPTKTIDNIKYMNNSISRHEVFMKTREHYFPIAHYSDAIGDIKSSDIDDAKRLIGIRQAYAALNKYPVSRQPRSSIEEDRDDNAFPLFTNNGYTPVNVNGSEVYVYEDPSTVVTDYQDMDKFYEELRREGIEPTNYLAINQFMHRKKLEQNRPKRYYWLKQFYEAIGETYSNDVTDDEVDEACRRFVSSEMKYIESTKDMQYDYIVSHARCGDSINIEYFHYIDKQVKYCLNRINLVKQLRSNTINYESTEIVQLAKLDNPRKVSLNTIQESIAQDVEEPLSAVTQEHAEQANEVNDVNDANDANEVSEVNESNKFYQVEDFVEDPNANYKLDNIFERPLVFGVDGIYRYTFFVFALAVLGQIFINYVNNKM